MPLPSGSTLIDIAVRTAVVYLALLLGLRLTGKRQVGQLTPFDFLLLLLLANAVQNAMTGPDTTLAGGLVAAATHFGANCVISWIARPVPNTQHATETPPTIVISHGQAPPPNLLRE